MQPIEWRENIKNPKVADEAINISSFLLQEKSKITEMLGSHEYVIPDLTKGIGKVEYAYLCIANLNLSGIVGYF